MSDNDRNELLEFEVVLSYQTDKAGLFFIEGRKIWLPWSQVDSKEVQKNGDRGRIYIPRWLAEQNELD